MNLSQVLTDEIEINDYILKSDKVFQDKWTVHHYKANEVICEVGSVYPYFFVVQSGVANVQHTSEKGKTYSQSIYGAGTYFGELEIFNGKPFVCGIEAVTDVTLVRMERESFIRWIRSDHDFLFYLMKTLCESSYDLSLKASHDTLYSLTFRICDYLVECEEKNISKQYASIFLSKKYLSEKFVVTKRSINRVLKELQDKGLIETDDVYIKVIDLKGLVDLREQSRYL